MKCLLKREKIGIDAFIKTTSYDCMTKLQWLWCGKVDIVILGRSKFHVFHAYGKVGSAN